MYPTETDVRKIRNELTKKGKLSLYLKDNADGTWHVSACDVVIEGCSPEEALQGLQDVVEGVFRGSAA